MACRKPLPVQSRQSQQLDRRDKGLSINDVHIKLAKTAPLPLVRFSSHWGLKRNADKGVGVSFCSFIPPPLDVRNSVQNIIHRTVYFS